MKKLQFCLALFSVLLLAFAAVAQIQNGQFSGTVTDPSGAAIPNAKVSVTNTATNLSVSTTSNQSGAYAVKELPPGTYKLSAEASGFRTVNNTNLTLNAGTIERVDFKMTLGQAQEVVEVTSEVTAVNTEEAKLATTISSTQISNLPLNGRNVYDLMQLSAGAVNVNGVDMENGHGTVVNGLREDFNGFLINGVANKGLSGGVNNTPIQDTVQEFQQLQLNVSAQYGNSAGSINNLVTKSGTNQFHGSLWEYVRNDVFDANEYFLNQAGASKPPLRFNQFGGTIGGPIIKDKLFFFGSYQGDRFKTTGVPQTITTESSAWRQSVEAAFPTSTAALLYKDFAPTLPGSQLSTLDQYVPVTCDITQSTCKSANAVPSTVVPFGTPIYSGYLCPDNYSTYNQNGGPGPLGAKFASLLGVTAQDIAIMNYQGCKTTPGLNSTPFANRGAAFLNTSTAIFGSQTQTLGNLFNGNEASGRIDYNFNTSNRLYVQFNWLKETDSFGPCSTACTRGFSNPARNIFPNGQLSYVHTFSPTILNEFKAGYTQNNMGTSVSLPGVPSVAFDDGTVGFGSYNGYPQFFKEHDYSYGDMVSISHGNHNIRTGVDIKRNIENSEFDIARGSYYFFDSVFFAADAPYGQAAGVNPGFTTNQPGALGDNVRHWRNLEFGAYVQDDWKVTKRLTLNLGLRYDLFTRHNELDNLATTFKLGPGVGLAQQVANANVPFSNTPVGGPYPTTCNPSTVSQPNTQVLAGVCGPGGFAAASSLGPGDHNNWGPRVGFAWDVMGDGKTSIRAGFGVSYESTLYNPLSNSRWNPPYYSFNGATNGLAQPNNPSVVVYGPTTCTGSICVPSGQTPIFTGPPTNPGQGIGAQATGNINGWASTNPDQAKLTGIVLPQGIRDPYVYNYFFSVQREVAPKLVVEADYVATAGHKLFRASDINSQAGSFLPAGSSVVDNYGRTLTGLQSPINGVGRPNPNYAILRTWENAVNSNYHALQLSAKKQMSHGVLLNAAYTWSHSLDNGSTWHSGSTTATGGSGGDGYLTDQSLPHLDYGNSVFDIRHRLVLNYVWELPGQKLHGALGWVAGGWNLNGIWAFQTGAHFSPYTTSSPKLREISSPSTTCTATDVNTGNCQNLGGDYNLNADKNDRPNSTLPGFGSFSRNVWANGWCAGAGGFSVFTGCPQPNQAGLPVLSVPCLACTGDLGRNTFVGPGQWYADMTLAKNFKLTERFNLKFEAAAFNIFNRANFLLAASGGGANNHLSQPNFGQAGATLNARNMQLGLKLSF